MGLIRGTASPDERNFRSDLRFFLVSTCKIFTRLISSLTLETVILALCILVLVRLSFLFHSRLNIPTMLIEALQLGLLVILFGPTPEFRAWNYLLNKASKRREKNNEMETKYIEHFSHLHPLILHQKRHRNDGILIVVCSGCSEVVESGPFYACVECNFFLHCKCAKLPLRIKHPIHRRHHLVLCHGNEIFICSLCKELCQNFFYHCASCHFIIDVRCADLYNITVGENHQHKFSPICKRIPITCDACGESGDFYPYMCTLCHLTVHGKCTSLPSQIRITRHGNHSITHTYFPTETENESSWHCGICYEKVSADHGCYCCTKCNYIAHAKCATRNDIWDGRLSNLGDGNNSAFINWITSWETEQGENVIATKIEVTVNHEHPLTLCENVKDDIFCDGCTLCISTPFYSCERCNSFLHKACAELPWTKLHSSHRHLLELKKFPNGVVICCSVCSVWFHGYAYSCQSCNFNLDPRCALLADTLKHGSHDEDKHELRAFFNENAVPCNGCGGLSTNYFKCAICDYVLDFKCATLPQTVKSEFDEDLILVYRDDLDDHYCFICEEERDPKYWFYSSKNGCSEFHVACVLGKLPYIRLGTKISITAHPDHYVTLVQKNEKYSSCNSCSKLCKDLALECEECDFIMHWECFENKREREMHQHSDHDLRFANPDDLLIPFDAFSLFWK